MQSFRIQAVNPGLQGHNGVICLQASISCQYYLVSESGQNCAQPQVKVGYTNSDKLPRLIGNSDYKYYKKTYMKYNYMKNVGIFPSL